MTENDAAKIERAFAGDTVGDIDDVLHRVYSMLEAGALRVAEPRDGRWTANEWVKKAILLSFKRFPARQLDDGVSAYYDRIPQRFKDFTAEQFQRLGARVTPGAVVRAGAYLGRDTVLMPCFVNVGAYVGDGSMVDTWATVGSCAQIGSNVHLSGGVGIGGVLEPAQATPTVIEDDCFVGARSEIVEGVVVQRGAVVGMGVFIGQSTPIYDRERDEVTYGTVPAHSVVVAGSLPRGKYSLSAAIVVKRVDAKTRAKTSVTQLLRGL
ncbi:MAG TPA: 2,3,4,5-tetrahydropyridine-2,6-dicarboxylate N-succinyltransferase [Pseudomonadales bacterium]|nr:2,3,4,5-tetrahydropyridine-2,6-dicarboxylate N-succinyltransferase [Pseudomonadales bacterium]